MPTRHPFDALPTLPPVPLSPPPADAVLDQQADVKMEAETEDEFEDISDYVYKTYPV